MPKTKIEKLTSKLDALWDFARGDTESDAALVAYLDTLTQIIVDQENRIHAFEEAEERYERLAKRINAIAVQAGGA